MKSIIYSFFIFLFSLTLTAQVGVGTTDPKAALDINASDAGLLIPRVALTSTTDVTTVPDPDNSELVYNTTPASGTTDVSPGFYYYRASTSSWVRFGGATGWVLDGNDVTSSSFIGSINNADIVFKRWNLPSGRIGASSTSIGVNALNNGANTNSTAIGNRAMSGGTGSNNVAIGQDALTSNTTGAQWNVAIGNNALRANTSNTTQNNVAIGYDALANQTGQINQTVAIGSGAARNSNGNNNSAIGYLALAGNAGTNTGIDNVAIGKLALQFDTSGQQNTGIGSEALKFLTSGSFNTGVGFLSGSALTTGSNNSLLGINSGNNITTGANNVVIGSGAQAPNATGSNQIVIGGPQLGATAPTAFVNAPAWSFSSDRRLKSNIVDSQLGLDFIKTIRPVSYYRKQDGDKKTEFGFIAQELEVALNKAGETNTGILMKTSDGMYAVRYNEFLPMTVKAVQEQQEQIDSLQQQNTELLKTNAAILKRLEELEKKMN